MTPDEPSHSPETAPAPDHHAPSAPAPRRRAPRWILVGAALAALLFLAFFVAQAKLTRMASRSIQSALSAQLGLPVSMEGLDVRLFPAAVTLQRMQIGSPDQNPAPLLTTTAVEVRFSLLSLLADRIIIHQIAVDTPQAELNTDRIDRVIQPGRSSGGPGAVIIRQVLIHNGTLHYTDPAKKVRAVLDRFSGTIDLGLLIERAAINLTEGHLFLEQDVWHQAFTSVNGRVTWTPSHVTLQKLKLDGPEGLLALDGIVAFDATRSVKLALTASLPLGQLKPWLPADHTWDGVLGLEANIAGPWTQERDVWRMAAPLTITGHLNITNLSIDTLQVGTVTTQGQLHQGHLILTSLAGELLSGSVNGHTTVSLPPSSPALDAVVDLSGLKVGPVLRRFSAFDAIPDGRVSGHLSVRGTGWTLAHLEGDGHLAFAALDTASPPAPAPAAAPAPLREALHRLAQITVDGHWHAAHVTLQHADIVSRHGNRFAMQGAVEYQGPMELSGSWQLTDLGEIGDWAAAAGFDNLQDWTGAIEGNATLTGSWNQPHLAGALTARSLSRHTNTIDEGRVAFSYDTTTLTWHDGHVRQGHGQVATSGTVTWPSTHPETAPSGHPASALPHVQLSITVTDGELGRILHLFDLAIPIDGRAGGSFTMAGSSEDFHLRGPVHVDQGRLLGQPIASSDLTVDVTSKNLRLSRIVLAEGGGVLRGSARFGFNSTYQMEITVETLPLEQLQWVHAVAPQLRGMLSGALSGSGTWKEPQANGRIELRGLTVGVSALGRGVITAQLAGEQLKVTAEMDNPQLGMEGTIRIRDDFQATLQLRFTQFPVALLLRPFVSAWPEQVVLTATGEGTLTCSLVHPSNLSGQVSFSTLAARLADYPIVNDGPIEFDMQSGRVTVHRARFTGEGTILAAEGSLTLFERYDLFVHGEAELAILRLFFPRVSYGRGKGYLALQITDRWLDPKMAGGVSIQGGLIRLEAVDQPITIAYAGLVFDGQQLVLDDLHGGVGKGSVQASGHIGLRGLQPTQYRVLMEVNGLPITPIDGLSGVLDGSLWLQGDWSSDEEAGAGRHLLKGDVQLVRAVYSKRLDLKTLIKEQPALDTVTLSLPSFLNSVVLQVRVWGHQSIWIRNNIATLPLDIDVEARGTVEHPVIVGRIFTTGGTVTFLHTPFRVTQGSIDFLDPKQTRPAVDLKANATVRDYAIDLALTGTADRIDMELSSDPALSQSDILSVLTVGRTSEEVSTAGASSVATSEAASLLVNEFLEEPAQQIGIDHFQVDSAVNRSGLVTGPQLTIGKELLDRRLLMLVSRPMDPTTPQSYRLEYQLNRHMSLVGDGDDSGSVGGDIKFRFDFR